MLTYIGKNMFFFRSFFLSLVFIFILFFLIIFHVRINTIVFDFVGLF